MNFNVGGFMVGLILFILCLFLAQALPEFFVTLSANTLDLLKAFFLITGIIVMFVGALSK